jgi:molybdenum cofactor biosynthesis enzyme MoaA
MDLFSYIMAPSLDRLQVEVTSYCNASCVYCPHTIFGDWWLGEHMGRQTIEGLVPYFRISGLAYLKD